MGTKRVGRDYRLNASLGIRQRPLAKAGPMKNWRALLIDEDLAARHHLRELLESSARVTVWGEASGIREAATLFKEGHPDLLFLDPDLSRGSGFDLLPLIHPVPPIVLVTASGDSAVRAFEVGVVDYLLKPVTADRLALALTRLESLPIAAYSETPTRDSGSFPLYIRTSKGLRTALPAQVTHVTAEGNYTQIWLENGDSHLTDRAMHEWEALLPADRFVRLDRSLLINLYHLRELRVVSRDAALLRLSGRSTELPIGRAARSRLRQLQHFR